jgi:hypothetical protein
MHLPLPPAKLVQEAALQAVLPPFVAAAAALGLIVLVFGRRAAVAGSAVAVAAGWAAGNYFRGTVAWTPDERTAWIPVVAVLAAAAGTVVRRLPTVGWALWAAVLAVGVVRLLPAAALKEPWWAVPAFVLLTAAVGAGLAHLSARDPGAGVPLLAAAALFTAGGVVLHAHSGKLLDVTTVAGSALLGVAAAAGLSRTDAGGAMPGAAAFLTGTLVVGFDTTYSEVPARSFVLPAVAPLAALLVLLPPLRRLAGWRVRLVQAILILVPLAAAVGFAARAEPLDFENL